MNGLNVVLKYISFVVLILVFVIRAAHAEDIAIIVGIGNYPYLRGAHLDGIDNDLRKMERALHKAKFRVIALSDSDATEEGIRDAFMKAAPLVHPNDRFVYYHSGHGSRDHRLLTRDTTPDLKHLLSVHDLQELLVTIPTQRKSVLIDACFSGGFKERNIAFHQVKFYPIGDALAVQNRSTIHDRTDTVLRILTPPPLPSGKRDYVVFASSQDNQVSQVLEVEGSKGSVFTHYLSNALLNYPNASWSEIVQSTTFAVIQETLNQQIPVFDSGYLSYKVYTTDQRVADSKDSGMFHVQNMAQLYNLTNVNRNLLALSATLDGKAPFGDEIYHPDTRVKIDIDVQKPGYLFVINRDDEEVAQLVGWGTENLPRKNAEQIVQYLRQNGRKIMNENRAFESKL